MTDRTIKNIKPLRNDHQGDGFKTWDKSRPALTTSIPSSSSHCSRCRHPSSRRIRTQASPSPPTSCPKARSASSTRTR